ncbi:MAG: membrane protein insertase YidC [Lactobacillaceae bacterium]|jgi:YidC/Oxa1 family membrane protein insertase|nr:membrane protein insertase YidC [Lactobacillaceae bacterium]
MMSEDTKGLYLAVLLSIAVIFLSNIFLPKKPDQPQPEKTAVINAIEKGQSKAQEKTDDVKIDTETFISIQDALDADKRIKISNSAVSGSIRVKGLRIDDLLLSKYKQTLSPESPNVELLYPGKTHRAYYADFGWTTTDQDIKLPTSETVWEVVEGSELTPQTPIVLRWENGQGFTFITKISIDDNYMFGIEQSVNNQSDKTIVLYPYGLIHKNRFFDADNNAVVHQGAIGVLNRVLEEFKYKDLEKTRELKTTGGWAGFSDRYWFTAFVLDNKTDYQIKFTQTAENKFQADYIGDAQSLSPNMTTNSKVNFFSGAKEIKLLDRYSKDYQIEKFDLAVDFGWYYFLTKPFFYVLDFLYDLIGNMGWSILLFAAILRLLMFPVANKSYESMSRMKKLQPKIQELQGRYGDDKQKLQMETMNLYKKEKINPASGCLPMFIQIPVFFSLYKVLNFAIEIRHAPFVGWIKDLSAPDPLTLSVLLHIPVPALLNIGIWPIIMGLTMFIQQKLNPSPANKDQARVFAMMPVIFTFMLGHFAAGLVIYWTLSNVLSIIQQRAIMKKNGVS